MLGLITDGLEMRKGDFLCVVIGFNRPVRAPTVNGCLDLSIKSIFSGSELLERLR